FYFGNPMIALVAAFLFVAGRQDAALTTTRELLNGLKVGAAMTTRFAALASYQSLEDAVSAFLGTPQDDFPVVGDDGRYFGLLGRADLLRALSRRGGSARVIDAARRGTKPLAPDDPLPDVLDRMSDEGAAALPVIEDGRLVGILTPDGMRKLLLVREAMSRGGAAGPPVSPSEAAR
ncbi:MAG TPA: CBS domain-containing protein, partial [Planctomycetota bacterium]|nr:CBS domain-containing protein [Planctomycetota bacterium]